MKKNKMALEHLDLKGKKGKLGFPTPGKQEAPKVNLGTGLGVVGGALREKGWEGPWVTQVPKGNIWQQSLTC